MIHLIVDDPLRKCSFNTNDTEKRLQTMHPIGKRKQSILNFKITKSLNVMSQHLDYNRIAMFNIN